MYRRYQATPSNRGGNNNQKHPHPAKHEKVCPPKQAEEKPKTPPKKKTDVFEKTGFLTRLIPQSLYNPQTGKVLGILSTDDLFLIALIILLIDNGDESEDNSMLIYALIYILISEHIELPF